MIHVHDILRQRLLQKLESPSTIASFEELQKSEWSTEFESYMRNRLIMGALRYGRLRAKGKATYDRLSSIKKRLDLYHQDGNLEHLVDCANLCLCEFVESTHPNKHFNATDEPQHHTKKAH